jgi:hypothetical protein
MYETLPYWETAHTLAGQPAVSLGFARIWQAAGKVVYSTILQATDTARTASSGTSTRPESAS